MTMYTNPPIGRPVLAEDYFGYSALRRCNSTYTALSRLNRCVHSASQLLYELRVTAQRGVGLGAGI